MPIGQNVSKITKRQRISFLCVWSSGVGAVENSVALLTMEAEYISFCKARNDMPEALIEGF